VARGKKKNRGNPARTAAPPRRPAPARPALSRQALAIGVAVLVLAGVAAVLIAGSGDDPEQEAATAPEDLAVP
jgi:hypothetical protein